ncbi:haloacid dehalogenase type II [Terrarubrum flagellatum]|uniref:haloacid dehalogenase type II n=1 Tax=Terrirubrum flagellatum TaxID=2895980 RepID=UPI003144E473
MPTLKPKFITFDCYGTLIYFEMAPAAKRVFKDRVAEDKMSAFCADFSSFRLDEVLGPWKPYLEVVSNAVERTCKLWGMPFRREDAQAIYDEIPSWNPHPDVPAPLARVAKEFPLVILSNSMTNLIPHSVAKLGAPFHAAYTAQEAQAYKPRMQAFEYMLGKLGCGPGDILHVSSSFRYDLMTAHDMHFAGRCWVNRAHEPRCADYATHEIPDISGLPGLLGL